MQINQLNKQTSRQYFYSPPQRKLQPLNLNSATEIQKNTQKEIRFSGLFDKFYNEFIAEPFAGYRKIVDSQGDLRSPAGSSQNYRQNRKNKTYNNFNFHNAGLKQIDFNHSKFSHGTDFKNSICEVVDFSNCDMPAVNFENSVLNGSDFISANLNGSRFANCDLETLENAEEQFWKNVGRHHQESIYSSFTRALSDFSSSTDRKYTSSFENANLVGANFEGADLRGVNFRNANLRHANFNNARLQNADLTGTRLLGASFNGAKLHGAKVNLKEALEKEEKEGNNSLEVIIKVGELFHNSGLKLNFHNVATAKHIKDLLDAKDNGKITEHQLKETLRKYFRQSINPDRETKEKYDPYGTKRSLPLDIAVPFVYEKTHEELLGTATHDRVYIIPPFFPTFHS